MIYTELRMAFLYKVGCCFVAMMLQFMKFIASNTDSRSGIDLFLICTSPTVTGKVSISS